MARPATGLAATELQLLAVSWGVRAERGPLANTCGIRGIRTSLVSTCLAQGNAAATLFNCGRDFGWWMLRSKLAALEPEAVPVAAAAAAAAAHEAVTAGVAGKSVVTGVHTAAAVACDRERRRAGTGFRHDDCGDVTMDSD